MTINDLPAAVVIAVHTGPKGKLSASSATVTVRIGGIEKQARVPDSGSGSWWHAMTLRNGGSVVDTPHLLTDAEPDLEDFADA